ncbi:hypothetical protein [Streptomyces sp. SID161]|uniref:hypothetical protein n=1 Tax=Streptomyces sp. SID161 TaxID=2690251 RepID=UPI001371A364|nr:hypothetical protein [Streptomyces sp. SID161]MYW43065.1 hypothetical protein [Streptomyces sp. SID161]
MSDLRWGWAAGLAVASVLVLSGCSDDGGVDTKPSASASASASKSVMDPRAALEAYQSATASGCTTADDCQEFMTRKLAAAAQVRDAMTAKDPSLYAEPIGFVNLAEEQADHYGRDNLGAKGNSLAVSLPLQRMVAWFREHPEG